MKYSKYIVYLLIISFISLLSVKANTEQVYYLDDLTPSKTIISGSKIIIGNNYPGEITIEYDNNSFALEQNKSFILGNSNEDTCYALSKVENNTIGFSKAKCKNYDVPSLGNDYTIEYKALYKWYRLKDVSINTDGFIKNDNIYNGVNGSLKVDFNAKKGEILFFKLKNNIYDNSLLEITLDGKKININNNTIFYKNMYLKVDNDGNHTLIISFTNQNDSYVLLKNFYLLSEFGNENKLNTFGLNNRDRIYYELMDNNIIDEGIIYYVNSELLDQDPFANSNPNTVDPIYIVLAILVVVLISLGFSIYKVHKTQKYKIHEEIE